MTLGPRRSLGGMSVGNIVRTAATRFPAREALLCAGTGRRFTFHQLNARSNRLAHALMALSLEPGSVVAFICSNRAEILETYVALAKSGLVGLPLNYRLSSAELETLINTIGAVAVIIEARFGGVLGHLKANCAALAHFIWIGTDATDACLRYEELLAAAPATEPDLIIDDAAPYYFNLTSGTTGLPKAYLLTQFSACAMHASMLGQESRPDDVTLVVFPAFGRVGLGGLIMSMIGGGRSVLVNFEPREVVRLIREESVTLVWLVPTMAALILEIPVLPSMDSLRGIGFIGSMLPVAIREQASARLCPHIYEGYGLQEAGILTMSTPEDRARKPESVGQPVLFGEVRVVDVNGNSVIGEIGEIVGRSPNCITEYYQSPAKNAEAFRGGWFHTGDLGRFDADGYLYICGRVKDMIISGGQNVHSAEIEGTLLGLCGVSDCAVVGVPHQVWGEVVTAVIVTGKGVTLTARQVQDFCRATLASFKVPRIVVFQDDPLPRTPTGKVQKFRLVERYLDAGDPGDGRPH